MSQFALLRWGWFGVFLYFTVLIMSLDFIQQKLIPLAGSPLRSYLLAGLIGTALGLVYWAGIIRLHGKMVAQQAPESPSIEQKLTTHPATPATVSQSPPTPAPAVAQESKDVRVATKKSEPRESNNQTEKQSPAINQTMTNSPGGMQAGRDIRVGQKPSPVPTEKDKKP